MKVHDFRGRLLKAIAQIKQRQPQAHLHLIYAPELSDPLSLLSDAKRETALIRAAVPGVTMPRPKETWPRLVTFDCRRVAAYLLETDPGLDDPLFEASISQSHAEVFLEGGAHRTVTNDDPGQAENAVCGWIVSTETAAEIARRLIRHAAPIRQPDDGSASARKMGSDRRWVHWYQPEHFSAVWPTLNAEQRLNLIGSGSWLTHTVTGELQHFFVGANDTAPSTEEGRRVMPLKVAQLQSLDNVPIVTQLTKQWRDLWKSQGRTLPTDADQQLHRHVQAARTHLLDDENLVLYVMVAVQLSPGGTEAPEFLRMIRTAVMRDASLREGLRSLPETFWEQYALVAVPGATNNTANAE